ncbi:MAG TPA: squalene cyclase [Candidatus Avipropionibacterium avicola]|uniref:Squalene cyclase n=1 Tax=Candidatus Avipropionibacterium avicola TaxID=2840701 RepID=A0A9D1H065_9ACTN|nr:squalene cyclase [Candidatus Avipropionibacterium avicola]
MINDDITAWLLDSDPALRWQVERDLLDADATQWQATRARVASEGFGAELLAVQDEDGQWAGGAYFPKRPVGIDRDSDDEMAQPWTATTWALNSLREWGLDPAVLVARRTPELLAEHCRWEYEDLPYWQGEVDCCINAFTVANGLWLGVPVEPLVDWLVEHRLDDGGWNCDWVEGARVSSYHSTLNALDGLVSFEEATGGTSRSRQARHAGEEYLLQRHLHRRRSTGESVAPWTVQFGYPFRWYYNVLRAADHFRRASALEQRDRDPRVGEAIELIRAERQPDGTWLQARRHPGAVWFHVDAPGGEPSKWITFWALRVLRWWDQR